MTPFSFAALPSIYSKKRDVLEEEVKDFHADKVGVQLDHHFINKASYSFDRQEFVVGELYFQDRFVSLLSDEVGVRLQLEGNFLAGFLYSANYVDPEDAQRKLEETVRCCT